MKIKNYFILAVQEIRANFLLFVFYMTIFILLLSVSITFLDSALFLTDKIASTMQKIGTDNIIISIEKTSDLEQIAKVIPMRLYECKVKGYEFDPTRLGLSQNETTRDSSSFTTFSGGVLLKDYQPNNQVALFISNNILSGEFAPNSQNTEDALPIWISSSMAKAFGIDSGNKLHFIVSEHKNSVPIYVQGLFTSNTAFSDYYISEEIYNIFNFNNADSKLQITVSPLRFRDIYSLINMLRKLDIPCLYSEQTIRSTQMMYVAFYISTIILLTALSGILFHLLILYYNRRTTFFAMCQAIGMSHGDVLMILFCISEVILLVTTIFSSALSYFVQYKIEAYINKVFLFQNVQVRFPFISLILIIFLLQLCILFAIKKVSKTIKGININELLRCE
ncbi:FtsX-like permease family protein [Acetivibrio clariflavus]|uniref:ABC-type transport system, involved in lipoprotein release, permease component n=1 Tax=Acetivibrio clariflavus (strain DSM 19732 / NBRC 101661 / EBR45) TaxID=720554 RepID=G8LVR4_ACECE|nr:FtsX-like permease family protein [Acetivibrio clariflavus]AEV69700.1 ABC-type transport system, involved in lipoprotein release, permease component [Acetivibrio clariflavus DSM 19732]